MKLAGNTQRYTIIYKLVGTSCQTKESAFVGVSDKNKIICCCVNSQNTIELAGNRKTIGYDGRH